VRLLTPKASSSWTSSSLIYIYIYIHISGLRYAPRLQPCGPAMLSHNAGRPLAFSGGNALNPVYCWMFHITSGEPGAGNTAPSHSAGAAGPIRHGCVARGLPSRKHSHDMTRKCIDSMCIFCTNATSTGPWPNAAASTGARKAEEVKAEG